MKKAKEKRQLRPWRVLCSIIVLLLILQGSYKFYIFYTNTIHPLNQAEELLRTAKSSENPYMMIESLNLASWKMFATSGNPSWLYPSLYTDWNSIYKETKLLMKQLKSMISLKSTNPEEYDNDMLDIKKNLGTLLHRMQTAILWEWCSLSNIFESFQFSMILLIMLGATKILWNRPEVSKPT